MALFGDAPGASNGARPVRRRLDGAGGNPGDGWNGVLNTEEVLDLAVRTAQLVSIHDIRLRELSATVPQVRVPLTSSYGGAVKSVDTEWKGHMTAYNKQKKNGEDPQSLGSKHVRLAKAILNTLYADPGTPEAIETRLAERWGGQGDGTTDKVMKDVQIMKWRPGRDLKTGVLEFKLVTELADVEQALIARLEQNGGQQLVGVAPRGQRARELDALLDGTWDVTRKS